MSWEKAFDPSSPWENEPSVATPLNETNLNRRDTAINTIDNRVVALDGRVSNFEALAPQFAEYTARAEAAANTATIQAQKSQSYAVGGTGSRTGEDSDNSKYYKEQAAASATSADTYSANASSSANTARSYAVGTNGTVRVGDDTDNAKYYSLQATSAASGAIGAETNANGYAKLARSYAKGDTTTRQGEATDNALYYSNQSSQYADNSSDSAEDSEAWATGKRGGVDVGNTDDTFQNNSKYYSQISATFAGSASSYAQAAANSATESSGYASQASASATNSANSASNSEGYSEDAEAWAVGTRNNVDVGSSDETYHNNAKYWAGQAEQAAGGGVVSFNGRSGAVSPLTGDYTATMVGLGNVDNTSDLDKPISTATQNALNGKMPNVSGEQGQMVGFDSQGSAIAQNIPNSFTNVSFNDATSQLTFTRVDSTTVPVTISSGHTISDGTTEYPKRSTLVFENANITDDSVNDETVVSVQGGSGGSSVEACYDEDIALYAHSVDDIILLNDILYKVTSAIAVGDTITENTNITANTGISEGTAVYTEKLPAVRQLASITPSSTFIIFSENKTISTITLNVVGNGTLSAVSNDTDVATVSLSGTTLTITKVGNSGDTSVDVSISDTTRYKGTTVTIDVVIAGSGSFASMSDSQIKKTLDAYYNDEVSWEDMGWAVGDARLISFNAMQAPNPNSSTTLPAQKIVVVIVSHDHTDLETPINGHTKSCITVQVREVLNNYTDSNTDGVNGIYVNGDSSYDTTFTKWSNLYMRTYLNSVVWGALASGDFKSAIKPSKHYRHTDYNTSTSEEVTDTLFLPSYPEIFGTESYSYYTVTSPVEGTQFEYYQTSANRIKQGNSITNGGGNGTAVRWWNGSASSSSTSSYGYRWCRVSTDGSSGRDIGSNAFGLAPAFAM